LDREEVLKILKLVADGKVSPEQGRDLLEEFFESYEEVKSGRKFSIEVVDNHSGKVEAHIRLPVRLAKFVGNFVKEKDANFKIGDRVVDYNLKEVLDEVIKSGESVEIETGDKRVTIKIED
jgi:polyhydroxyalkanoate synthesis regulator phasin